MVKRLDGKNVKSLLIKKKSYLITLNHIKSAAKAFALKHSKKSLSKDFIIKINLERFF
jgi:hypothetical protein